MRLICGILRLDGCNAQESTVHGMAAAMTGPGLRPLVETRLDGPLGLAVVDFRRVAGGVAERDGWLIAADLRLDDTRSDPLSALIDATRRHGEDFPDRLNGDFAAAVWRRDRGALLLGRDFIGARPLAWTWRAGRWFAFASMPKALHRTGLAMAAIDPVALGTKLLQGYFTGADSGFSEIEYLEAGHSLAVRVNGSSRPRAHRAYRPVPADIGVWRGSPEEAAETLRHLVSQAVAARMPASGGVSCHLTGGLDSSAITLLAAQEARRRGSWVLALSATTPEALGPPELDERPLIAEVLSAAPDLQHLGVDDLLPMPDLEEDVDWPGGFLGGHDDRMAAAAAGTERLLCGVGGDEAASYNGANLYPRLLRDGHLRALWLELPGRARTDGASLLTTIRDRLIWPMIPVPLRRFIRQLKGRPAMGDRRHGAVRYLNPGIAEQVTHRCLPVVMHHNGPHDRIRVIADHHIPSRCTYYAIMAARHGLPVSFPLLDRRVVDFMLSLPTCLFLADGQSRQPFRRAMRGLLPDAVRLAKNKVGLYDDRFVRYATHRAALLTTAAVTMAAPSPLAAQIFDLEAIHATLELLPTPAQAAGFVRTRPGSLPGKMPPWQLLTAIQCLIAARRLSTAPPAAPVATPTVPALPRAAV